MSFFLTAVTWVGVVLFFGLAIFVHEFGHYLAARLLGLRVDAFSIGFGPAIWQKKVNGTVYKVAWFPLGGYVALPQLDPTGMDKVQGERSNAAALPEVSPWKRIVVSFAGPLGNVVLAVLIAVGIYLRPVPAGGAAIGTTIGFVAAASQPYEAGLKVGDRITHVAGKPVETWMDIRLESHLAGKPGELIPLTVARETETLTVPCLLTLIKGAEISLIAGIAPNAEGDEVVSVLQSSPAESAGLKAGDRLLSAGGWAVTSELSFPLLMRLSGTNAVPIEFSRAGQVQALTIVPAVTNFPGEPGPSPLIGVELARMAVKDVSPWMRHRHPVDQLKGDAASIVRVLEALLTPKTKGESGRAAKALGGPIMIITQLHSSLSEDFVNGLGFLRFLCINLAMINLFPLPVLDGGHILFALYEIVFRRKLPTRAVEILVNAFAILLIGAMLLLVYRDIVRII